MGPLVEARFGVERRRSADPPHAGCFAGRRADRPSMTGELDRTKSPTDAPRSPDFGDVARRTKVPGHSFERRSMDRATRRMHSGAQVRRGAWTGSIAAGTGNGLGGTTLTRALRSHQLWLSLTYLGLLALMARAYL